MDWGWPHSIKLANGAQATTIRTLQISKSAQRTERKAIRWMLAKSCGRVFSRKGNEAYQIYTIHSYYYRPHCFLLNNETDSELGGSREIGQVDLEVIKHYTEKIGEHANIWYFYRFLTAFSVHVRRRVDLHFWFPRVVSSLVTSNFQKRTCTRLCQDVALWTSNESLNGLARLIKHQGEKRKMGTVQRQKKTFKIKKKRKGEASKSIYKWLKSRVNS